jgi:acrylyl-CoA reductase (NADPH)
MFPALVLDKSPEFSAAVREVDDAFLPEGDVTVAVAYSTLNYKDGLAITNRSPVVRSWPMVAGIDGAGTVLASDSPLWKARRRGRAQWLRRRRDAQGLPGGQGAAEGQWLVRRPPAFSARQAMAIGTAGYTAMLCVLALERHGLAPGRRRGAGDRRDRRRRFGGRRVAARLGTPVVAATGKASEAAYLQQLGAAR